MDYSTKEELFNAVKPAFEVKKRLSSYRLTSEDIWNYLIENKWKMAHNLTISDIVNDIINIDEDLIKEGVKYEKN